MRTSKRTARRRQGLLWFLACHSQLTESPRVILFLKSRLGHNSLDFASTCRIQPLGTVPSGDSSTKSRLSARKCSSGGPRVEMVGFDETFHVTISFSEFGRLQKLKMKLYK